MPQILLPSRVRISFFLSRLFLLCSGLVLLDQSFFDQSLAAQAQIIPNGAGTVVNAQGNQINITGGTQAGANLFHSFRDFHVNSTQIANFLSNPQTQNILARINGGNPSIINGLLQVTGGSSNLFLMNPAGIVFGQGASLNIPASFTATTANQIGFGNNLFNAFGDNNFSALVGNPDSFLFTTTQAGSIVNAGNLAVGNGQNISLIAGNTINTGRLTAPGGEIQVLAVPGTNRVRLSQPGQVLSLEIIPPVDGVLRAIDLPALLTGNDLPGIQVSPTGVQVAGTSLPNQQGLAIASGAIDVSSTTGNGGVVQVMGDRVAALNSRINANGATGGGTVRLGGEYLGGRDTGIAPEFRFNSQRTLVDRSSLIRANATNTGEGGRVIVWADQGTGFFGRITGRGATERGGFVEVSGRENLAFDGQVELQGFNGLGGTLLLDPADIIIQAVAGNGDTSLPVILAATLPDPMTISVGALASIAAGTAINLTASNSIDFQTNIVLTANGTAPITFTAPNILASLGAVSLESRGRNIVLNVGNINAQNLSLDARTVAGTNAGNIQATASTGNLIIGTLFAIGNNANSGAITLNAPQGNITFGDIVSGTSGIGNNGTVSVTALGNITSGSIVTNATGTGNGGAINLSSSQGNITSGFIQSLTTGTGNGGTINFTAQGNITSGFISSRANSGSGGAVNFTSSQGNITTDQIISSVGIGTGNGGTINLTANQGSIITGDINSISTNRRGGDINILAQGNIRAEYVVSGSITNNGGNIRLTSTQGNITTGGINSRGDGVGNASGTININAGNLFRVTGICGGPSICSDGQNGAANGAITIRHGGGTTTPFIVGDPTTNGTGGRIDAGTGNIINTTFSVPVPPDTYTQGIVRIITTASPVVPPVVNDVSSALFALLRTPDAPPTPAAVIVGSPSVPEPIVIVEPPTPPPVIPPVIPVLIPEPILSPPVVNTTPIPTAIAPPAIPALNLSPEMITNLNRGSAGITPEPPSGTLTLITNPSSVEVSMRLSIGLGDRISFTDSPASYNLAEIQNNLNQTSRTLGIKPALIYFFFAPDSSGIPEKDTLEVILITEKGEPLRVQFLDVTRRQVLAMVNRLQDSSAYLLTPTNPENGVNENSSDFFVINGMGESRRLQFTSANRLNTRLSISSGVDDPRFDRDAARQIYQWLVAPLEQELQAQGIDNLVFLGGAELRGISLGGLYDGQRFVRERYTIR